MSTSLSFRGVTIPLPNEQGGGVEGEGVQQRRDPSLPPSPKLRPFEMLRVNRTSRSG